jgi:hypothetical protein
MLWNEEHGHSIFCDPIPKETKAIRANPSIPPMTNTIV